MDAAGLGLVLLAGFLTGVLSGMFGIGGAVVSTPAIRVLGATPLQAVGSTLPSIVPSAISGSLRYQREGLIVWRVVRITAGVGIVGSIGGALLTDEVPGGGHVLMILTASLLLFTAIRTAQSPKRPDPADAEEPVAPIGAGLPDPAPAGTPRTEPWRLGTIGLAAGLLSGLLGIGGGILLVPAFSGWVRLDIKAAVGTSLACVGILAIPGMVTHQLLGHIDWGFALPLCIAVIPGARLGAHLAIRATDRGLRISVATVLGTISLIYAVGEILSMLS